MDGDRGGKKGVSEKVGGDEEMVGSGAGAVWLVRTIFCQHLMSSASAPDETTSYLGSGG